jgi:hypothetical protein
MKGDFTRFTHEPEKHYSGVLQQQGRVSIDADWNENVQIEDYLRRFTTRDIIGHSGVPHVTRNGFKIDSGTDILILRCGDVKPARLYVDGILCEMEKDVVLPQPSGSGTFLIYLDVWRRHITAVEDSEIAEVALGGPDTATRIKTEWQVRYKNISEAIEKKEFDYKRFCSGEYVWLPEEYESTGKMAAQAEKPETEDSLCKVGEKGGYRGLENRLYRVEVHKGGVPGNNAVTFKWSRDNGSVVFPVEKIEYTGGKSTLTLKQTGKDDVLTLHVGDWVEISDDRDELNLNAGTLAQVAQGTDMSKGLVVLETDVSGFRPRNHAKIRRWDQKDTSQVTLTGGTMEMKADIWLPLEDGVEVKFKTGVYQAGDYWLIPARTRLRDVLWDVMENNPLFETHHGTHHHYAVLAAADFDGKQWSEPEDLRRIFWSLNELPKSCCINVYPGQNIQRAIDCVVASGGGCICLCRGVHHVRGPLKLDKARNVTICGEKTTTVVHFHGTNEDGEGGFILNSCTDTSIRDMFIVGDGVPSLITLKGSMEARPNLDIGLENLTMFNRTMTQEKDPGSKCALRMGNSANISVLHCRMMAENGIISLFGDELPDPGILDKPEVARKFLLHDEPNEAAAEKPDFTALNYGKGVMNLKMRDSMVFYRYYGVWSLKSASWDIEDSRIFALPEMKEGQAEILMSENPYQSILNYFASAPLTRAVTASGTAIKALIWKDCNVRNCTLSGLTGMTISFCAGGEIAENTVTARSGILVLWQHNSVWKCNKIDCLRAGIAISGSFRSRIEDNRIQGAAGIVNVPLAEFLDGFDEYLVEIVRAYSINAIDPKDENRPHVISSLWVLLEEACRALKITGTRDAIQDLMDTMETYKGIPVLLIVSLYLRRRLQNIAEMSGKIPMPIIALKISGNEIEAQRGIRLNNFIPMGGLNISGNRIETLRGQAVLVRVNPFTVNPYVITFAWRYLFKALPTVLRRLIKVMSVSDTIKDLTEEQLKALENLFGCFEKILAGINIIFETIVEADYRIENNSIRSHRTAVETNIFETAIQNNHITMEESVYSVREGKVIVEVLDKYASTKDLATGMRQRSRTRMQMYVNESGKSESTEQMRKEYVQVSAEIRQNTENPELQTKADNLSQAAKDGNKEKIQQSLNEIVEVMESYADTCGIWIKGAGCRVVGNHVVVPMDADSKTWAQGGIRFWDDEGSPIWLLVFLEELIELYAPGIEVPSLLGATETLIDNNEIIRGYGHGVEINGIANMLLSMGLADIKIRGNQIQDMAGAGVAFDEKSMTIGADIEGNRILDCGSADIEGSLIDKKGGLVICNTVACRIMDNRIRCASNLKKENALFAVDIQKILQLTMSNNFLQHEEVSNFTFATGKDRLMKLASSAKLITRALENLCGVVRISEMYGEVTIQNNDIILSQGIGAGLVLGDIDVNYGFWHRAMSYYSKRLKYIGLTQNVGTAEETTEVTELRASASVQGNHFESAVARPFFAFLIGSLREMNFSGNNVRTKVIELSPGFIIGVARGVVNNNMLDTLAITMGSGVIAGNVSNTAIVPPSGVTSGMNQP